MKRIIPVVVPLVAASLLAACQSSLVTTTAKSPDVNTYWRCGKCGEVWNVSRRASRRAAANPWG